MLLIPWLSPREKDERSCVHDGTLRETAWRPSIEPRFYSFYCFLSPALEREFLSVSDGGAEAVSRIAYRF